ncbi:hypothetical protein [Streptomyces sp. NBC_00847]|uniref:hypothetical protein n=1 Tax=Streptomyces sp. NBC_00847 TaxID=2975850 RepID=UPI00225DDCEB|nr:hypothetical protein [Streptomyces sp. NBC_00847]MCX4885980.1 hypothetical protein [Streptomyces sp. NBC_00847]
METPLQPDGSPSWRRRPTTDRLMDTPLDKGSERSQALGHVHRLDPAVHYLREIIDNSGDEVGMTKLHAGGKFGDAPNDIAQARQVHREVDASHQRAHRRPLCQGVRVQHGLGALSRHASARKSSSPSAR